jgi:2-dehydro-3-deoxyphosphogluconate aldolase/(4S)-4-hydroxy-2-oxoglutarate aldolase
MAFRKQEISDKMKETGVIPLFTHDDPAEAQEILEAVYKGGVRVFEFTNRTRNSYNVFVHLVKWAQQFPDLMLGIGTIMDGDMTKRFIDAGAHFIISPILKVEMAQVCYDYDRLWIPGCATLTEIVTARDHGAEIIKVFPGSVLGPNFVSSIMPVVPGLQLMITGGVEPNRQSLTSWFKAGAVCVGLGSQLFNKDILAKKDWPQLQKNVAEVLKLAQEIKTNL